MLLVSTFHFIFYAGSLNDEFSGHKTSIDKNRLLIKELQTFKDIYFSDFLQIDPIDDVRMQTKVKSYLHVKLANEIIKEFDVKSDQIREQALDEKLQEILSSYDILSEGVAFDSEHSYITLLGIEVTKLSTLNGLIAILSSIFASYQLIMGSN